MIKIGVNHGGKENYFLPYSEEQIISAVEKAIMPCYEQSKADFIDHYINGLTLDEIAEKKKGTKPATVNTSISRCVSEIKALGKEQIENMIKYEANVDLGGFTPIRSIIEDPDVYKYICKTICPDIEPQKITAHHLYDFAMKSHGFLWYFTDNIKEKGVMPWYNGFYIVDVPDEIGDYLWDKISYVLKLKNRGYRPKGPQEHGYPYNMLKDAFGIHEEKWFLNTKQFQGLCDQLDKIFETLDDEYKNILIQRYVNNVKIEDICPDKSTERTRQKLKKALQILRHPARSKTLRAYLNIIDSGYPYNLLADNDILITDYVTPEWFHYVLDLGYKHDREKYNKLNLIDIERFQHPDMFAADDDSKYPDERAWNYEYLTAPGVVTDFKVNSDKTIQQIVELFHDETFDAMALLSYGNIEAYCEHLREENEKLKKLVARLGVVDNIEEEFEKTDPLEMMIEEFDFSVRLFNALRRTQKYTTFGDLIDGIREAGNSKKFITSLRNAGARTATELNTFLKQYGYEDLIGDDE